MHYSAFLLIMPQFSEEGLPKEFLPQQSAASAREHNTVVCAVRMTDVLIVKELDPRRYSRTSVG